MPESAGFGIKAGSFYSEDIYQIKSWEPTKAYTQAAELLDQGFHTILVGSQGTAKSFFLRDRLPHFQFINAELGLSKEPFFGFWRPTPEGGLERQQGMLHRITAENPNVIVEEIGFLPSVVASPLFTALDGIRQIYIDETGETLNLPENFRMFGTANSLASLPAAFLDRFLILEIKQPLFKPVVGDRVVDDEIDRLLHEGVSVRAIIRGLKLIPILDGNQEMIARDYGIASRLVKPKVG